MVLAYFITFTTYGTRLPGNAKGSVDMEHNVYGTPLLEADEEREEEARRAMAQPEYRMKSAEQRDIVCKAIVDLAAERSWDLLAVHVRTTHVHVVVTAERDPDRVMSDFKARASFDLTQAGYEDSQRRRWTRGGSTPHLFTDADVEAAIHYVLDEQGERMSWSLKPSLAFAREQKEPRTK